jgi:hypothetical protein
MSWADNYDDFCLPDEVLAAIDDLGAAPRAPCPTNAVQEPVEAVASMFDAFLPAGPLQPAHGVVEAALNCASASLPRAQSGTAPPQLDRNELPSHEQRIWGEAQLLRAKLQQAEQQALQVRAIVLPPARRALIALHNPTRREMSATHTCL